MRNIEDELKIKSDEIDSMKAPLEMEDRLRRALDSEVMPDIVPVKRRQWRTGKWVLAAAVVLFVAFGALNFDVLAYYGKKIFGYDEVTSGSLKELNTLGMGQEIDKSYTFKNGTKVTLDGVMLDENKLVAMYTINGDSEEKIQNISLNPIEGFWGSYVMTSGQGLESDNKKEIKWVQEFISPSIFDRDLNFTISSTSDDVSRGEVGRIPFKLDMNKAIKHVIKCDINQTVEFQGTKYKFNTLSATPLSVVVEGSIFPGSQDEWKIYEGRDLLGQRRTLDVELTETYIQDGKPVTEKLERQTGGMGTGTGGISFDFGFDGLKPDIQSLVLSFVKVEDTRMIDKKISITPGMEETKVVPNSDELVIKDVKVDGGNTVVVFDAQVDVAFEPALMIGGEQSKVLDESPDTVSEGGKELIQKTYKFEGSGSDMQLMLKTLSREQYVNKDITVYSAK